MNSPQVSESTLRNRLLQQLESKEITKDEFRKECAYWALKSLNEYVPVAHKGYPPQLKEYVNMSDHQKSKVPPSFWSDPEIYGFMEEKQRIVNQNRSNFQWLCKWYSYIPKEDTESRERLLEKISEYRVFFQLNPSPFYKYEHKETK